MMAELSNLFIMVFNIPSAYRAAHLRNFFSEIMEQGGFETFHYRHRPMNNMTNHRQSDRAEGTHTTAEGDSKDGKTKPPDKQTSCCCIAKCNAKFYQRLASAFHLHHWKDEEDRCHATQCFIYPVYCIVAEGEDAPTNISSEFIVKEQPENSAGKLYLPYKDILEFKEMKPPDMMPHGNVGTPTRTFLELINSCRLPPLVVKKLGLKFKKEGGKFYSSVPYDYTTGKGVPMTSTTIASGPAVTGHRHKILNHADFLEERAVQQKINRHRENTKPHRKLLHPSDDAPTTSQTKEVDSDGETEEWDRHEAFYDDAGNYERNKERLYEEKIELKWEKGGSGLVFYTDAQYWKQLEGDFDEQTADDWDVDMSEYYEPGTGDKDARDFVKMRAEDRLRGDLAHLEEISAFDKPIGSFEQHTKGVGRTVLEKQGWQEGKGVGKTEHGRAHIIDNDGQHPRDKRGLGFRGEKVARFVAPGSRKRNADAPIVSTIYDDPATTDEPDTLMERKNPHNIKHRSIS